MHKEVSHSKYRRNKDKDVKDRMREGIRMGSHSLIRPPVLLSLIASIRPRAKGPYPTLPYTVRHGSLELVNAVSQLEFRKLGLSTQCIGHSVGARPGLYSITISNSARKSCHLACLGHFFYLGFGNNL